MRAPAAALALCLAAMPARADDPKPAPDAPLRDHAVPTPPLPWQHYFVPAIENAVLHLTLLSFNTLVTRQSFALISPQTMTRNLDPKTWTFDADYYLTNQFGHPYQGALSFGAARGAGLSFWWSALYTTLSSAMWELFYEAESPSVNDQITTSIGGSLLGEALHRAAHQALGWRGPGWIGRIGATLLDPMTAITEGFLGQPHVEDVTLDPLFVRWEFGATAGGVFDRNTGERENRMPLQALVSVLMVSGPPWDPRSTYDEPLSYFDLRADLAFPRAVVGNIFIRGLLWGSRFGSRGVWGLFGDYDYAAPAIIRASAVSLGPGLVVQGTPLPHLYLQFGGVLGGSPFAAAGQLLNVSPDEGRDYHVGPGIHSVLELRLIRPHWFSIDLVARNWVVFGAYVEPLGGVESINYLTLGATIPVWKWLGVGLESTLSDRRAHFAGVGDVHDTGLTLRLTMSVLSEPHFGVEGDR